MAHRFSVLLHCDLQVFLRLHLDKGLAAGTTLARVGEVDAAAIVDNLAVCMGWRRVGGDILDLLYASASVLFFFFFKSQDEWTHT